jgi:hypothetical protein
VNGPYAVILETPKQAPELVWTTLSHKKAEDLRHEILRSFPPASGVKVYVRTADSADQLQVTRRGWVVRDQPSLPRRGEDVTVHVPTVHLGARSQR